MRVEGFVDGAYETQSRAAAGEQCVNCFPEPVQGHEPMLVPIPGLANFDDGTITESPGRGIFFQDSRCFTVFGRTLYELDLNGVPTSRGTLAIDSYPVTMDTNGDGGGELFVVSGDTGYVLNLSTNTLTTEVTDVTQGGQIDGFFVALDSASSTLKISESLDGTTWDATQIAQRTSRSDPWISMVVARGEIYLLGEKTGEVWFNAGLSPFPFAERPEGSFDVGIAAIFSLAKFAGTIAWLGRTEEGNPAVYWLDGYTPNKLSSPGIEWLIQTFEDAVGIDDAVGWSYSREGHTFYVLDFPSSDYTLAYDLLTRRWHRRGLWDGTDFLSYRARFQAAGFNRNLVCDANGTRVYSLSSTTYTDAGGEELRRLRQFSFPTDEYRRAYFSCAELDCDRGVGVSDSAAQGADPLVALQYSNDGGQTFGASRTREVGALGEYTTRVRWENCGSARERKWRVWSSDPVATRWRNFYVDVDAGLY